MIFLGWVFFSAGRVFYDVVNYLLFNQLIIIINFILFIFNPWWQPFLLLPTKLKKCNRNQNIWLNLSGLRNEFLSVNLVSLWQHKQVSTWERKEVSPMQHKEVSPWQLHSKQRLRIRRKQVRCASYSLLPTPLSGTHRKGIYSFYVCLRGYISKENIYF